MNREERLSRRRELYRLRRERETTEEREERLARQIKFLDDSQHIHVSCSYYTYIYIHVFQGSRKQIWIGQASFSLQKHHYSVQSMPKLGGLGACPPRKILKNRY